MVSSVSDFSVEGRKEVNQMKPTPIAVPRTKTANQMRLRVRINEGSFANALRFPRDKTPLLTAFGYLALSCLQTSGLTCPCFGITPDPTHRILIPIPAVTHATTH